MYKREKKANEVWLETLDHIINNGKEVNIRGKQVLEVLNYQTTVDIAYPVVSSMKRKLGYRFMAAEAYFIIEGKNSVAAISKFSKKISDYSDDGIYFSGAYGPKIVDQLTYVVDKLMEDEHSRQAVINIWRESPRDSKDIPCTLSYQVHIRDGRIYATDNMRSSDIWLGWPYDIFNFTMLTSHVVALLHERGFKDAAQLKTGSITLNAGSQHLYLENLEAAKSVLNDKQNYYEYSAFNMQTYNRVGDIQQQLLTIANKAPNEGFMKEFV